MVGAYAEGGTEISQLRVERVDDEMLVSALVVFELPAAVEDALLKGIPMYFSVQAEALRERWYWYDKRISIAERQVRLAFQPLTRSWRLNVSAGGGRDGAVGLVLNQTFDTLGQALAAVKRLTRWRIADASSFEVGPKYKVELRFRLDLSQLPRPFQIGAMGQADWDIA
ncbi:MAG: DUF4390 domain-containing protein, partial [Rhodoferax sp.]